MRTVIALSFLGFFVILAFFMVDVALQGNQPGFHIAPGFFEKTGYHAITLPPIGVYILYDVYEDPQVRAHELVHWDQYKDKGTILFYTSYITDWIRYGYDDHPMEIDARQRSDDFLDRAIQSL